MTGLLLPTSALQPGTSVRLDKGEPPERPPEGEVDRWLQRLQNQWRKGGVTNEQVVELTDPGTLYDWQRAERTAYRRRRLFDGGTRSERHRGTQWHAEHYYGLDVPAASAGRPVPAADDASTTTTTTASTTLGAGQASEDNEQDIADHADTRGGVHEMDFGGQGLHWAAVVNMQSGAPHGQGTAAGDATTALTSTTTTLSVLNADPSWTEPNPGDLDPPVDGHGDECSGDFAKQDV